MAREINRLTHLEIDEISLVDHPANSETDASCRKWIVLSWRYGRAIHRRNALWDSKAF